MKKEHLARFSLTALSLIAGTAFSEEQGATVNAVTYLNENASILWRTIKESTTKIALDWPNGAASAVLTVKVGSGDAQSFVITDTSATAYNARFTMPTQRAAREVVTLAISYRDSNEAEISSKSVKLGLVDGVGNGASIMTKTDGSTKAWRRFYAHEVVQIPPDATSVTIDGEPVNCEIPGWYDMEVSEGEHVLTLKTDDGTLSATVIKSLGGLMIIFK